MERKPFKRKPEHRGFKPRAKGLGVDPEKVREFQRRGRQALKPAAQPLARGDGLSQGKTRPKGLKAGEGPLAPGAWREAVLELDDYGCVWCGAGPFSAGQDHWSWSPHHVIPAQTLRFRGLLDKVYDPRNGIVVCKRCHEKQEQKIVGTVPREKLPARVFAFAQECGPWACDLVDRYHPPTQPGGVS